MSIRLDPRRLSALKLLAAEAGVRPGELVTSWVEERLDAARAGRVASPAAPAAALAELTARLDDLARRVDRLSAGAEHGPSATDAGTEAEPQAEPAPDAPKSTKRRRPPGRSDTAPVGEVAATTTTNARVPLHEEIIAVIAERGPLTAAQIAEAIIERGRYAAPRSTRPLDAGTVNSRVSNPAYRARFTRDGGRIGLADGS